MARIVLVVVVAVGCGVFVCGVGTVESVSDKKKGGQFSGSVGGVSSVVVLVPLSSISLDCMCATGAFSWK